MISADDFRVSRDEARARLDPAVARESFRYYIDFSNFWESYRHPEDLIPHLGIHRTHQDDFTELLLDLGPFNESDLDWARRYVEFYDRVARLISTTALRPRLEFDVAETLVNWRDVEAFVASPARILEFGAGGGRQGVAAFLRHPEAIYTAIDSTVAAYTVQNLVFSFINALRRRRMFHDLLDAQLAGERFPDITAAEPGAIYHVPAWFEHEVLPARFYDVMLACFVHGELSKDDFLRFVRLVDRSLADDGVLYVRSELAIPYPKGYFEAMDLHGQDIVALLRSLGIVPVSCAYRCVFQTTMFARVGSSHERRARASTAPEAAFLDLEKAIETTVLAGHHWVYRRLEALVQRDCRVLFCGRGFPVIESLIAPYLARLSNALVLDAGTDLEAPAVVEQIRRFGPDVIVAGAPDFYRVAERLRAAAGGSFALTLHRVLPMCLSYREYPGEREPALTRPVMEAGDIDRNRGDEPWVLLPDGGMLASPVAGLPVR